jgi:CheY-like chemotaxis protein
MDSNRPRPLRVLVVDDSSDMLLLARLTIGATRHAVIGEATDGTEAIAKAAFLQPDAVVLDLEMPWMDGVEALPHIRRVSPHSIVIIWTAAPAGGRAQSTIELGADAIVGKTPVHLLIDQLDRVAEHTRADSSTR